MGTWGVETDRKGHEGYRGHHRTDFSSEISTWWNNIVMNPTLYRDSKHHQTVAYLAAPPQKT